MNRHRFTDQSYFIYFEYEGRMYYSPFYSFVLVAHDYLEDEPVSERQPDEAEVGEKWRFTNDRGISSDFFVVNYDYDTEMYELLPVSADYGEANYAHYRYDRSDFHNKFKYVGRELNSGETVMLSDQQVIIRFISKEIVRLPEIMRAHLPLRLVAPETAEYRVIVYLPDSDDVPHFELNLTTEDIRATTPYQYRLPEITQASENNAVEIIFQIPQNVALNVAGYRITEFVRQTVLQIEIDVDWGLSRTRFGESEGQITLQPPAQPSTPPRQGTARTAPPELRRPPARIQQPHHHHTEEPQEGDIWKNTTGTIFAYILSTFNDNGVLIVRYRYITDIDQLVVGDTIVKETYESFRDIWQYYRQGPRVGYEANRLGLVGADIFGWEYIVAEVTVSGENSRLRIRLRDLQSQETESDFASRYEYRPPPRRDTTRRNLEPEIENESKAQLGVEYTLEEFREKDYPDEQLVFKRFRYDYETGKWVSTKMVFTDDGVSQEMSEVDCDITPLEGDEWGLRMPVKTKVQKPTGEKVWDKNINGELYLYCATDLRNWLNSNKFSSYGLYVDNEDETYTQNQKNDQTPRTQLKIVAVEYLSKEERDTLQEEYKQNAQDRKLKADERKRERGDEDEAIEKRRKTAEDNMRKALSKNNEQIISTLKRQLNAAEKEIWDTEAQDTSSFNSIERETYDSILAGARKRITEFKAKLKNLGETAWVKEWEEETNKQARKKEWRISFLKGKVIEEEKKIITRAFNDSLVASLLKELKDLGEEAWVEELDKSRSTRIEEYIGELTSNTTTTIDEERTYSEDEREYDQGYNSESKESDDSDSDSDPEGLFQSSNSSSLIRRTSRMLKF